MTATDITSELKKLNKHIGSECLLGECNHDRNKRLYAIISHPDMGNYACEPHQVPDLVKDQITEMIEEFGSEFDDDFHITINFKKMTECEFENLPDC